MVASVSFVSTGTFNHVFPSLPMHTLWKRGYLVENKGFLCLLIFPCMLDEGYLEDKSVPHYLWLESIGELWTVSDDTVPYTFEQSLCQLLFPNLEHFNCGRKFRLCACLKRMNTEMCFCACVYMKSARTTIIRQSNSIQNRQHTTRDSLGYHVFTN
jgi:hypothetical protein